MREHGSGMGAGLAIGSIVGAMAAIGLQPAKRADSEEITIIDLPTLDPFTAELLRDRTFRQSSGTARRYRSASRYMPHIGAKERARHAGKPDGPMHVTGWQRRAEHAEWLASQA